MARKLSRQSEPFSSSVLSKKHLYLLAWHWYQTRKAGSPCVRGGAAPSSMRITLNIRAGSQRRHGRLGHSRHDKLVAARPFLHVRNAWALERVAIVYGCGREALLQRLGLLGLRLRGGSAGSKGPHLVCARACASVRCRTRPPSLCAMRRDTTSCSEPSVLPRALREPYACFRSTSLLGFKKERFVASVRAEPLSLGRRGERCGALGCDGRARLQPAGRRGRRPA